MKNYKKVQMVAKNAPTGSYAAGCPTGQRAGGGVMTDEGYKPYCSCCEIAQ